MFYKVLSNVKNQSVPNSNPNLNFLRENFGLRFLKAVVQENDKISAFVNKGVFKVVPAPEDVTKIDRLIGHQSENWWYNVGYDEIKGYRTTYYFVSGKGSFFPEQTEGNGLRKYCGIFCEGIYFRVAHFHRSNTLYLQSIYVGADYRRTHIAKRLQYFFLKTLQKENRIDESTQIESEPEHVASYKFIFPNVENPEEKHHENDWHKVHQNVSCVVSGHDKVLGEDWERYVNQ